MTALFFEVRINTILPADALATSCYKVLAAIIVTQIQEG